MAEPTPAKRTANVPIRTTPEMKLRLEKEAQRRGRPVTWVTEQCWEAYLPILEAEKVEKPRYHKPANPQHREAIQNLADHIKLTNKKP